MLHTGGSGSSFNFLQAPRIRPLRSASYMASETRLLRQFTRSLTDMNALLVSGPDNVDGPSDDVTCGSCGSCGDVRATQTLDAGRGIIQSMSEGNLLSSFSIRQAPSRSMSWLADSYQWMDTTDEEHEAGFDETRCCPLVPRSSVRVVVVICSAAVAILVPNVGLLVSLAGASSGAALSLVCPSLMAICIPDYDYEEPLLPYSLKRGLCAGSIALGVLGAIAGTAVAISDISNAYF